jgi:hypothetical protein
MGFNPLGPFTAIVGADALSQTSAHTDVEHVIKLRIIYTQYVATLWHYSSSEALRLAPLAQDHSTRSFRPHSNVSEILLREA